MIDDNIVLLIILACFFLIGVFVGQAIISWRILMLTARVSALTKRVFQLENRPSGVQRY